MKVIIIDDHRIITDGLELLLSFDKNIVVEKSYQDARLFLEDPRHHRVRPDIVLTDLMMPGLSGSELSKTIKKEFDSKTHSDNQ